MKKLGKVALGIFSGMCFLIGIVGMAIDQTSEGRSAGIFCILVGCVSAWGVARIGKKTKRAKRDADLMQQRLEYVRNLTELPVVYQPAGILLRPGERCLFQSSASVLLVKDQVVGRTGGGGGVSLRVSKGGSIHSGSDSSRAIRKDVCYTYPGIFSMTDQRMIMTGEKAFEYPLGKLTSCVPYNGYDGIILQFGQKSYTLLMSESFWIPKIIDLLNAEKLQGETDVSAAKVIQRGDDINLVLSSQDTAENVEIPVASIHTERIDPDKDVPAPPGAALSYLDAKALEFWNKKTTDYKIPQYYSETAFGRNAGPACKRLLAGGYLEVGGIEKSIALKTIPELKAILSEKELKTSGNKPDLIRRLIDNVPLDELDALFPVGVYQITSKGEAALEPYSIVSANDAHGLGLSYYRLMKERATHPEESDNDILTRLMSEDIQRCYRDKDKSNYQVIMNKLGRFMHETGDDRSSLECYILGFFVWVINVRDLGISSDLGQNYYAARAIDESGKLCGYSLQELESVIRNTVKGNNPFALGSDKNIRYALSEFRAAIGA